MSWVTRQTGEVGDVNSRNGEVFAQRHAENMNYVNVQEYAKALMEAKRIEREIEERGTAEQQAELARIRRERIHEEEGMCTISGGRKSRRSKKSKRKSKKSRR